MQADEKFKALTPAPAEGGAVDIAKVKAAIGETPEAPWVSWVEMLKKKYIQPKAGSSHSSMDILLNPSLQLDRQTMAK